MRLLTHVVGSQAVWLLAAAVRGSAPDLPSLGWAALGSVLPEIDKPDSLIGRAVPFSKFLEERFGHRGPIHSLLATFTLGLVSLPLWLVLGRFDWWLALQIGYLSHLLLDMATLEGVALFWPHPGRAVFPGRDDLRLDQSSPTASKTETAVLVVLMVLSGAFWPLSQVGVTGALRRALGNIEGTIPEYQELSSDYELYLSGRFKSRISGEVYEGSFPIAGTIGLGYVVEVKGILMSVGEGEDYNLIPLGKVHLRKGPPIEEETVRVDLSGLPLSALLEHIPADGTHYIFGTLKLSEPIAVRIYPDRWNPVRGSSVVELEFARWDDLAPYAYAVVESGAVAVRVRRPAAPAAPPHEDPKGSWSPTQGLLKPIPLRLGIPSLSDLLVGPGDHVEEGEPIAVEAHPEVAQARRELAETEKIGGILGKILSALVEARLAEIRARHRVLSPISGTVVAVEVQEGSEEGLEVVLHICPDRPSLQGRILCSREEVALGSGGPPGCVCQLECYFVSPRIDHVIKRVLLKLIDSARETIDIAIYSFTDDDLGKAVVRAFRRGVRVRVIMDTSQPKARGGEYRRLTQAGIPVLVEEEPGLMHHKFMVIDGETVVTGSYNWSAAADDRNFENAIVVRDPEVARAFTEEFERLWEAISAGRTP